MSKNKYEREIEEILTKYEHERGKNDSGSQTGRPSLPQRLTPSVGRRAQPGKPLALPDWKRLSAGQYMLAAFGAGFLAVIIGRYVPMLASVLVILAVVLFLVPILLYHNSGSSAGSYSPHEEKRWRGQVIDFNTRRNVTNDPLGGIKRWLRRQ